MRVAFWMVGFAAVLCAVASPVDAQDATERLNRAAEAGDPAGFERALRDGARPTAQTLVLAARAGSVQLVDAVLETGIAPDDPAPDGIHALAAAVEANRFEVADRLLQLGADASATDEEGSPLVAIAAAHPVPLLARRLLDAGADPDARNPDNISALHGAARSGAFSLADRLISEGAEVDAVLANGITPLWHAATAQKNETLLLLLCSGADPAPRVDGETPAGWLRRSIALARGNAVQGDSTLYEQVVADREATLRRLEAGCDSEALAAHRVEQQRSADQSLIRAARRGAFKGLVAAYSQGASLSATDSLGIPTTQYAARAGSLAGLRFLLQRGADPAAKGILRLDGGGYYGSPLVAAVGEGHLPVVRYLLGPVGISPDDRERSEDGQLDTGWTGLHWAASRGNTAIAEVLLDAGASIDPRDGAGQTPLLSATLGGAPDAIPLLLERGANPAATDTTGYTALHYASYFGQQEAVEALLAASAPIDATGPAQQTPLHFAVLGGSLEGVRRLLDAGADLARAGGDGRTPLHSALYEGHADLALELMGRGASLTDPAPENGDTPLHMAATTGLDAVVARLLESGQPVDVRRTSDRATPLMLAAIQGHTATVDQLLDAGASPSTIDSDGWSVLHWATGARGTREIVQRLLQAGAEVGTRANDGDSPLLSSLRNGATASDLLLDAGAPVDVASSDGWTPLHFAARDDRLQIARRLLDAGAPVDVANVDGWTPLLLSAHNDNALVVRSLLCAGADPERAREGMTAADIAEAVGHRWLAATIQEGICDRQAILDLARADSLETDLHARLTERRGESRDVAVAEEVLALRTRHLAPDHPDLAEAYSLRARAYDEAGDALATRAAFEEALAAFERSFGPDPLEAAAVYNNLGAFEKNQGNPEAAREAYERAVDIRRQILHPHERPRLVSEGNLVSLLFDLRQTREALRQLDALVEGARRDSADAEIAVLLLSVAASQYAGSDRMAESADAAEAARARLPEVAGRPTAWLLQSLSALGSAAQMRRDLEAATRDFELALRVADAVGLSRSAAAVDLHLELSELARATGADPDPALEEAESIVLELSPSLDTSEVLRRLAHERQSRGDLAQARQHYEAAWAALEAVGATRTPEAVLVLENLATLVLNAGDGEQALRFAEESVALAESVYGPDSQALRAPLRIRMLARLSTSDRAGALRDALRASSLSDLSGGERLESRDLDFMLEAASVIHNAVDDGSMSALVTALVDRAVEGAVQVFGSDDERTARYIFHQASLRVQLGNYGEARAAYERAARIQEARLGPMAPVLAKTLAASALYLPTTDADSRADAERATLRAAAITTDYIGLVLPALSLTEQQRFIESTLPLQTHALLSTVRADTSLARAHAELRQWKGLLVAGLRRQRAVAALAADPDFVAPVRRLDSLRTEIAAHVLAPGPRDAEWKARADALASSKESLERYLLSASGIEAGIANELARLPAEHTLVDLYAYVQRDAGRGIERYGAFVGDAEPRWVDLGTVAEVDATVSAWREAVLAGQRAEAETDALRTTLWAPLAAALPEGTQAAWISPDAALARVPWSILAGEIRVAQVASPRELAMGLDAPPDTSHRTALLVGDVAFGDGASWAPLPGTEAEVEALSALAETAGLTATLLSGDTPTPEAVADRMEGAAFVHLATHGFFYGESRAALASSRQGLDLEFDDSEVRMRPVSRSPLAESGLALAGANEGPHGTLTAEELVGLALPDTRLVVLSACETGRGAEVTGQGVLGLQSAFAAAGAGAVLMSLWSVPDASTAALMAAFYRGLWQEGRSPAEALALAQAEVRATPGWEAPVHWAAWVLTGDAFTPVR